MKYFSEGKLIQLLKLLSAKEFKGFKHWLHLPWSRQNKYFITLYLLLEKASPRFPKKSLDKIKIFQALYGAKKKFNASLFSNLISEFTKEVENYLAHLRLSQQPQLQHQLLGEQFLQKKEIKRYENTVNGLLHELEKKEGKTAKDYLLLHQLNKSLYYQPSGHHRYKTDTPLLQKASDHLDTFYLLERLMYHHEIKTRAKILKLPKKNTSNNYQAITQQLIANSKLPVVQLFDYRLQQPQEIKWADYEKFKTLYDAAFPKLHFDLQQLFLFCCINDLGALYAHGHPKSIETLHGLYQFGFKHQLLLQNNSISEVTYNNIILIAAHMGDLDFIRAFISSYQHKLPKIIRKEALSWSLTQLDYLEGNYEKTIKNLNQWLPSYTLYTIQAKITLLKANFKLAIKDRSYSSQFDGYCRTFERTLRRNSIYGDDRSKAYLRYIQYARKVLHQFHQSGTTKNWERIIEGIQSEKIIFGKEWLIKEIKEMI